MRKTGPHELLRFGGGGCGKRKQYLSMVTAGALSVALALCPVAKVQAASFDCGKATSEVEKMICADAELSEKDEELSEVYAKALKTTNEVEYLKQQQREWLMTERNRSVDDGMLRRQYLLQTTLMGNINWLKIKPVADVNCSNTQTFFEDYFCGRSLTTYQGNENQNTNDDQIGIPSRKLSQLDAELQAIYVEALEKHFDPQLLHREQLAWQRQRERCVLDDNCSDPTGLYRDRIYNLRYAMEHPPKTEEARKLARIVSIGSPSGANFTFDRDLRNNNRGSELCESLIRWFNFTTPKGNIFHGFQMIKNMPGIAEPAWQELDINQHKTLYLDVLRARYGYHFSKWQLEENYKETRARGARLWMVKEDILPNKKPEIVLWHMSNRGLDRECTSGDCDFSQGNNTLIALEDLSGVDDQATGKIMSLGRMFYYKRKPFLFIVDGGGTSGYASSPQIKCIINNYR